MKVLIAVHGYPPTHTAGAERTAQRMARWLATHGHYVEVFAIERTDQHGCRVETAMEEGVIVHRLHYDLRAGGNLFLNTYDNPQVGEAFGQVVAKGAFDLVHMVSGYLLGNQIVHTAHKLELPVVITLTEYWYLCPRLNLIRPTNTMCIGPESHEQCLRCLLEEKRRYRLPTQVSQGLVDALWLAYRHRRSVRRAMDTLARRHRVLRDALAASELVICPSRFIIGKYAEYGVDTSRFVFIRHGIHKDRAVTKATSPEHGDSLRIGYLGQIQPHKGVDLLIDAVLALLKEGYKINLDVWGQQNQAPAYSANLRQRSLDYPTIRWRGTYDGTGLWDALTELDIVVVPSRWYENCPAVILEAYQAEVPVVATNLGGMAELVEHEKSGLLFELDNGADLRHQLQRLLREPALLARLRSGIPQVKSVDDELAEIFACYRTLLDQTRQDHASSLTVCRSDR